MSALNDAVSATDAITLSMRSYYSINHLAASAFHARTAARIETAYTEFNVDESLEHKSAVMASIFMSVAAVEAFINELFCDCADAHTPHLAGLDTEVIHRMACAWKSAPIVEKASIIEKYQFACLLADKPALNRGAPAAQDLSLGIEIRNALMHYKPQSVDMPMDGTPGTVEGTWKKIAQTLRGRPPLKPNPFASSGQPEFPYRVLGHDCAERTLNGSVAFLRDFANHLGLTAPPFLGICSTLHTR